MCFKQRFCSGFSVGVGGVKDVEKGGDEYVF